MKEQNGRLAAHWSVSPLARIVGPMQHFVRQEASSGIILLVTTLIALLLANSPWKASYTALLETQIMIAIGPFSLSESVLHWINDGLMVLFFFLVGLEMKREVMVGELSSVRAAALPVIAAFGGVIVPAGIYMLFNAGRASMHGWGVPMATDIAFALGCLALLGDRIPFSLKIFLTAVAIADDLFAVLVIALFYSNGLNFVALGIGIGLLLILMAINLLGVREMLVYVVFGVFIWLAFLKSGVHATIAGVLIALTIPARMRIDAPTFLARAQGLLNHFEHSAPDDVSMLTDANQQNAVIELEEACEQVQAPLQKMEHKLQAWVALAIMPLFALANAGVTIALDSLHGDALWVILGVALGLLLGKPIGLLGATWLTIRLGWADLPLGTSWRHMIGVGVLAGIGFTMSLFIATLAFDVPELLTTAKMAILLGSLLSGTLGLLCLRLLSTPPHAPSSD